MRPLVQFTQARMPCEEPIFVFIARKWPPSLCSSLTCWYARRLPTISSWPVKYAYSWRVLMAVETKSGSKSGSKTSPREVLERAKAEGVEVVDVRFIDLPGTWQHFSLPLGELDVDSFKEGLGFDGSSIRGFQSIDESDMLLMPDPDSATIDPVLSHKTLFLICDVVDPISREPYSRDAGFIAKKPEV